MNIIQKQLEPFALLIEAQDKNICVEEFEQNKLLSLFREHKLVVLRNFIPFESSEDFAQYCTRWGEIAEWPFGQVLELKEHKDPKDHIFDHSYVPLHWDGMYRPQVPEMQIFQCVQAPDPEQGGRTTFSHTMKALANTQPEELELWKQITGTYKRKMEFYHSETIAPIIAEHPIEDFSVIRYCEPPLEGDDSFINHPDLEFTGATKEQLKIFQKSLKKSLYHPNSFYAHTWKTGDIVFSDNHCLLHGREAFKKTLLAICGKFM